MKSPNTIKCIAFAAIAAGIAFSQSESEPKLRARELFYKEAPAAKPAVAAPKPAAPAPAPVPGVNAAPGARGAMSEVTRSAAAAPGGVVGLGALSPGEAARGTSEASGGGGAASFPPGTRGGWGAAGVRFWKSRPHSRLLNRTGLDSRRCPAFRDASP